MQAWSLARRLLTLFALAFGLVVASGAVALFNAAGLRASQSATEQAAERVRLATGIRGLNAQIFAADRAILVAHTLGDPAAVTAWHDRASAAIADGERQAARLERLVVLDEDRRTAADLARGLRA